MHVSPEGQWPSFEHGRLRLAISKLRQPKPIATRAQPRIKALTEVI
jgi:hypothetical protein